MKRSRFRRSGFGALLCAAAAVCAACNTGGEVRIVPVYPADEPELLDATDVLVDQIVVQLFASGSRDTEPAATEILPRGQPLKLDGLDEGPWTLVLRGNDAGGREVVYGQSHPFRIVASKTVEVRVFFARSQAFNFVALEPAELAAEIDGLRGHTATPFDDADGKEWILVAGGYRDGGIATADAYVIDPARLAVVEVASKMSRNRVGHTAIAIEPPGRAPLVVIADGGDEALTSIDVFDTATREFRAVDVPCGATAVAGIVPALTHGDQGALVHSGRVILPGESLCVVDPYGEVAAETWPSPTGAAPVAPAMSASNAAGQLVVVDGDGVVWADSAVERTDGVDLCEGGVGSVWDGLGARVDAVLTAVGPADRFAVIGGASATGGFASTDWATIALSGCAVTEVVEGIRDRSPTGQRDPAVAPAVLDLSSAAGVEPAVDLLVTGGGESPIAESAMVIADSATSTPLWYEEDEGSGHTPPLRAARKGHAVAVLENRSAWVIGGGDGTGWAEIFEIGDGASPLGADTRNFAPRRPVLTATTVLDETEAADALTGLLIPSDGEQNPLLEMLLGQQVAATVCLIGTADRGIGDDLTEHFDLPDSANCTPHADVAYDSTINGIIYGNAAEEGIDSEGIDVISDKEEAITSAQQIIDYTANGTAYSLEGSAGWWSSRQMDDGQQLSTKCGWRQYVRVGFDGLGWEGEEKDATYSGINVLIWVVAGDDCSQGVYFPGLQVTGEDQTGHGSPADYLSGTDCTSADLDGYFHLPPSYPEGAAFEHAVEELVWDPKDLIIGIIAEEQAEGVGTMAGFMATGSSLPRRLGDTADVLANMGAEVVPIVVDSSDGAAAEDAFTDGLLELSDRIAARNPYQTCVPEQLVGEVAAPFESGVGEDGLFVPLTGDSDTGRETIKANIRESCRAFRSESTVTGASEGPRHVTVVGVDGSLGIGVDTDRRAGCDRGWTVYLDVQSSPLPPQGGAYHLQCIVE